MKNTEENKGTFGSGVGGGIGCLFACIGISILLLASTGELITVIKLIFK